MKPISLTIQAFGPYRDSTSIDFSQLGEHPIFLITGATGGGKTTLLDAMCFALYCRATGGRRSWASMRSTAAPDDRATVVDFSFLLGQERYRFCRSQMVHIVRGSGRRDIREEHVCYHWQDGDWQLLLSGSETKVRDKAQQLLGLTCEQFSQVIVLPQGDFLKLLRANSGQKAEMLQTLFATKQWADVTVQCKRMAEECAQKAGESRAARQLILEREGVETREALLEKHRIGQETFASYQSRSGDLQKQLEQERATLQQARELAQKFQEQEALQERWEQLCAQQDEMERLRESIRMGRSVQRIVPYLQAHRRAQQELAASQNRQAQAERNLLTQQQALRDAEQAAEHIPVWREKAAAAKQGAVQCQESYRNAVRLEDISKKIQEQTNAIEQQTRQHQAAQQQCDTAQSRLKNGESHVAQAQKDVEQLEHWMEQVQVLTRYQEQLETCRARQEACQRAEKEVQVAQADWKKCSVQTDAQRSRLEQEEARLRQNQAHTLASTLHDGEPCPVCGSTHHPTLAGAGQAYDAEQLALLRTSVQDWEGKLRQYEHTLHRAQAKREQCEQEYHAQQDVCRGIPIPLDSVLSQKQAAEQQLQQARQAMSRLEKYRKAMEQIQQEQEQAQARRDEAAQALSALDRELAVSQTHREEILRQVGELASVAQLEERRAQLAQEETHWTQQADEAEQCLAKAKTALAVAQSERTAAQEATRDKQGAARHANEQLEQQLAKAGLSPEMDWLPFQRSEPELAEMEAERSSYERARDTVQEQLDAVRREVQGKELPDVAALSQKLTEREEESRLLAQQLGGASQQLEQLARSLEQLDGLTQSGGQAEETFAQISRLSQLLLGKNPRKIPLQSFVLGIMLDDVLSCANRFFSMFSQGRYSLRRVLGNTGGNALAGLDLEVLDAHAGGARSIETLSGGEQFLASLSLAFGLSDVVQSYSGSVRLDSIFIDEGFGSLDQETLNTAMKALAQIQRMGRTIGLISHVSELKGRIAARIEVGRLPSGSACVSVVAE